MSALSPLLFISSFYKHFVTAWVSRVVRDPREWLLLVASTIIVSPLTGFRRAICVGFPVAVALDEIFIRGYMLELHDIEGYYLNGHWTPTHELVILLWVTGCLAARSATAWVTRSKYVGAELVYAQDKNKAAIVNKYTYLLLVAGPLQYRCCLARQPVLSSRGLLLLARSRISS